MDISELNQSSGLAPATSTTTKRYVLNENKALRKKLRDTTIADLTYEITRGGLKLKFSTAAYEAFKCATREVLYAGQHADFSVEHKIITDSTKTTQVEYQIKVKTDGKNIVGRSARLVYVSINLYNTRSSALVNGRQLDKFYTNQLPTIIQKMNEFNSADRSEKFDALNEAMRIYIEQVLLNGRDHDTRRSLELVPADTSLCDGVPAAGSRVDGDSEESGNPCVVLGIEGDVPDMDTHSGRESVCADNFGEDMVSDMTDTGMHSDDENPCADNAPNTGTQSTSDNTRTDTSGEAIDDVLDSGLRTDDENMCTGVSDDMTDSDCSLNESCITVPEDDDVDTCQSDGTNSDIQNSISSLHAKVEYILQSIESMSSKFDNAMANINDQINALSKRAKVDNQKQSESLSTLHDTTANISTELERKSTMILTRTQLVLDRVSKPKPNVTPRSRELAGVRGSREHRKSGEPTGGSTSQECRESGRYSAACLDHRGASESNVLCRAGEFRETSRSGATHHTGEIQRSDEFNSDRRSRERHDPDVFDSVQHRSRGSDSGGFRDMRHARVRRDPGVHEFDSDRRPRGRHGPDQFNNVQHDREGQAFVGHDTLRTHENRESVMHRSQGCRSGEFRDVRHDSERFESGVHYREGQKSGGSDAMSHIHKRRETGTRDRVGDDSGGGGAVRAREFGETGEYDNVQDLGSRLPSAFNAAHAGERGALYEPAAEQHTGVQSRQLLIGSSIIKGVRKSGLLPTVDVKTLPGATVETIEQEVRHMDLRNIHHIIVHVGGNDASENLGVEAFKSNYTSLLRFLTSRCTVTVSGILPRGDTDVEMYDNALRRLCEDMGVAYVRNFKSFVLQSGELPDLYYHADKVHLRERGTARLLLNINESCDILSRKHLSSAKNNTLNYSGGNRRHQPPSRPNYRAEDRDSPIHRPSFAPRLTQTHALRTQTKHQQRDNNSNTRNMSRVRCRVCGRVGHGESVCWYRD